MVPSSPVTRIIRFGIFEADLDRAELRRRGVPVRIQEQPFRILKLLLEQPGQVVSRAEIRSVLWPDDTFVDFDHSLNAAVAKLRQLLGDSAENPRFVDTVARRGYRFIAPVDLVGFESDAGIAGIVTPATGPAIPEAPRAERPDRKRGWLRITAAICCVTTLIAAILYSRRPPTTEGPVLTRITADAGLSSDPAFSPDGRLVAYASDRTDGRMHIWLQEARAGGQAVQLTSGEADDDQPCFSPDGSRIAFRSRREDGGIYVVPTLGGTPVLIAPGGRNPRFSPDGQSIAYWIGLEWGGMTGTATGNVYIVPSGGGSPRLVTSTLAVAGKPVWSPDGASLLVYGRRDIETHYSEAPDWWVVPVGGGAAVRTGVYTNLRRAGFDLSPLFLLPHPSEWTRNGVLFSVKMGDSVDLWRIQLAQGTWQVIGSPEQLLAGAGFAVSGSAATDGRFAFASITRRMHVWTLPVDANSGKVLGAPQQLTDSAATEHWPSLSNDGRLLAYSSTKAGSSHVVLRDLQTGKQAGLAQTHPNEEFPRLSGRGGNLAYTVVEDKKASVYVALPPTMTPKKVADDGDWVWGWSPDARYLLLKAGGIRKVRLFELATRRSTDLLDDPPGGGTFQASFSSDGHWLTFMNLKGVFVAPFHGPGVIPKQEWISIAASGAFDDKPRWAPDDSSIYFTSDRDGSRCIFMQRLNGATKQPVGEPVAIYHSHEARKSLLNAGSANSEIAVGLDGIVFLQSELTGNVWIASPRVRR